MAFLPGFGKGFNLEVEGGADGGVGGGFGIPVVPTSGLGIAPPIGGISGIPSYGGYPGYPNGGWGGVPYVPITPLGALGAVKGDLIVPIVAVGVAIFILIIIILAVKTALAWKLSLISGLADSKFKRDTINSGGPIAQEELNHLAGMVISAIQSQTCAQNVICQVGSFARNQSGFPYGSLIKILETMVPTYLQESLQILRISAEGTFDCSQKYKCGFSNSNSNRNHVNPTSSFTNNHL